MIYAKPGTAGALVTLKPRYGNYIGGEFVAPLSGQYFSNTSPVDGSVIGEFPRSNAADIDKALDAAHAAADAWGRTSVQERSHILLKIADRIEANLELLAVAETWDNGKPVRETLNAGVPLAADHFRYFAGCIRAQEGSTAEINDGTVAYHFHEPLGVVGQIIPWNFPILMAAWKLAPALAAGNCVVLKPAEQTPLGICVLMELIGDNRDELEGEVDDSDVLSPDFQDSYPELYALLLEAAGSTEDVETMISDAMGISENTGIEFWSAVANVLALAKFGHFDDLLSKSGRDYSYVCKTGKFEVLSSDSTYFSDWLSRSAPYVQETAALSSQGGEVFNSIGESDLHVDLRVAIEPIAISGVEFLTENYEYHHENLMNGEIECVSACINLNDATLAAIEGWKRSIPIIAAIAAVSNARKG